MSKKCECGKQPSYGFAEDERPTYCSECKKDGMINIRNKKCICGKRPSFGFPEDKRPICCVNCKEDRMIDIISKKCICGKQPFYGFAGDERATCCTNCKKDGMINIKNKKCKANEICPKRANPYYDGYCAYCFVKLFPNHPKTANIRKNAKELKVVNYISSQYSGFIHNKPIGPSRRRIDIRKRIKDTLLCIEIDEYQHRSYSEVSEEIRYNDLSMDFSGKFIFIRYNPDEFGDKKGKKRNPKFEIRMEILEKEIEKHMLRIKQEENEESLEIHYLYYNSV